MSAEHYKEADVRMSPNPIFSQVLLAILRGDLGPILQIKNNTVSSYGRLKGKQIKFNFLSNEHFLFFPFHF